MALAAVRIVAAAAIVPGNNKAAVIKLGDRRLGLGPTKGMAVHEELINIDSWRRLPCGCERLGKNIMTAAVLAIIAAICIQPGDHKAIAVG